MAVGGPHHRRHLAKRLDSSEYRGFLLAVFYETVWTSGILSAKDFILGLTAFGLLSLWEIPPSLVVAVTALGSAALPSI